MQHKAIIIFIFKKLFRIATLLVALSLISFLLIYYSPIDPVQAYIGADMLRVGPEQREKIAEHWGVDKSPSEQLIKWSASVIRGDFGTSLIYRRPVLEVIGRRFKSSLALMGTAWLLSGLLGFVMGSVAAMREGTWIDRIVKWYCITLAATPTFWIGLVLLIIFAVWLGWLPVGLGAPAGVLSTELGFWSYIRHLILPSITLSIVGVANVALHTRQKLIDVLSSDYVLFARARGEKGLGLFFRHCLRNISLPAITLQFTSFSELFGGAVLAEQVFSYPGLGQTTVQAGLRGDVPLLLGIVIFSAIFVFTGNLLADLIYIMVDPRIRQGGTI